MKYYYKIFHSQQLIYEHETHKAQKKQHEYRKNTLGIKHKVLNKVVE